MAAEQPDEILLTIKVSEEELQRQEAEALQSINRLKKAKQELDLENRKGSISAKDYAQSQAQLNRDLADANKQYSAAKKTLTDYNRIQEAAEDSIEQMRAKLALQNQAYVKLSKSERENAEVGKLLLENMRDLSDELKELESAYGSNQRNVGNYGTSLKEQQKLLAELQDAYADLNEEQRKSPEIGGQLLSQIDKLTDAQEQERKATENSRKSIKDYVKDLTPFGIRIGDVSDKFRSGTSGVLTFAKGIFTTRGALIALTAVPIVLVLTAIVAFFNRSKEGAELFSRKMAAVTAVFDLLLGGVVKFGRAIVGAFDKPGEAVRKLGTLIKENLINRLDAYKVILDGFEKRDYKRVFAGVLQLFTGVENLPDKINGAAGAVANAAREGERVAAAAQKIADEERKLNVERANSRARVEELKKVSDDVTKSTGQRLAAAQQAGKIEADLLARQLALQQRRVKNIKDENALRPETKDGVDALAEAEQRLGELKEESTTRQIELQNKETQIRIEGQKQVAQLAVTNAERALFLAREAGQQTNLELLALEEDLLRKKLALDLVGVVKGSEQEKTIREKYRTELFQLNAAATLADTQQRLNIEKTTLIKRLAQEKAGSDAIFNIRKGINQRDYLLEVANANATIKNKQELNAKLLELDQQYADDQDKIEEERRQNQLAKDKAGIEKRIAQTKAGTVAEFKALRELRAKQLQQELDDKTKTEEEKAKITEQYRRAEADANKAFAEQLTDQIVQSLQEGTSTLSGFIDASITKQITALDAQQAAVLSSAALTADQRAKIEADFAKKREKIEKEAAEKRRKIASLENIVNTAAAVTKAFATAGPIFGPILAALAVAKGVASQITIDNQKFEMGGYVKGDGPVFGPSHAQGGVKMYNRRGRYVGEMEGDEIILTKGVYRNPRLRAQASALNVAGGGKAFAGLNAFQKVYDTTHLTPKYSLGGVNVSTDADAIGRAVVDSLHRNGKFVVQVVDINREQGKVAQAQAQGDT